MGPWRMVVLELTNFRGIGYEKYGESFPICPETAMEKWASPVHWPFGTKGGING